MDSSSQLEFIKSTGIGGAGLRPHDGLRSCRTCGETMLNNIPVFYVGQDCCVCIVRECSDPRTGSFGSWHRNGKACSASVF